MITVDTVAQGGLPNPEKPYSCQRLGFTLIELLIAMVVLAAATTGVLVIFANATAASADPQIRVQARSIAEAYMDEILLQPYTDPGGATGETSRAALDDVWDYDGIDDQPPRDQFGNSISALNDYRVRVAVTGGGRAEIEVRVTHGSGKVDYTLHSERYDY